MRRARGTEITMQNDPDLLLELFTGGCLNLFAVHLRCQEAYEKRDIERAWQRKRSFGVTRYEKSLVGWINPAKKRHRVRSPKHPLAVPALPAVSHRRIHCLMLRLVWSSPCTTPSVTPLAQTDVVFPASHQSLPGMLRAMVLSPISHL